MPYCSSNRSIRSKYITIIFIIKYCIKKYIVIGEISRLANITDFEKFRTSAGLVLEVIKHQDSEQEMEQILTRETALHNIEQGSLRVHTQGA